MLVMFLTCLIGIVVLSIVFSGDEWTNQGIFKHVTSWAFFPCGLALFVCSFTLIDMFVLQKRQDCKMEEMRTNTLAAARRHDNEKRRLQSDLTAHEERIQQLGAELDQARTQAESSKRVTSSVSSLVRTITGIINVSCSDVCRDLHHASREQDAMLSMLLVPQNMSEDEIPPPLPPMPGEPEEVDAEETKKSMNPLEATISDMDKVVQYGRPFVLSIF